MTGMGEAGGLGGGAVTNSNCQVKGGGERGQEKTRGAVMCNKVGR